MPSPPTELNPILPPVPTPRGQLSASLLELAGATPVGELRVRHLFEGLAGRGHAALLVVLSLPFCLPIPLPGLSVAFGLVLAFVGLRIAFAQRPWLPAWLLNKPLRHETLLMLARRLAGFERRMQKTLRPRIVVLCRDPRMHRLNGLVVALMGALLALPLPIPFSNIPVALPILLIGLGLLEDDGLFLIAGYAAAFFGLGVFVALFWFGNVGIEHIIHEWHRLWD